LANRFLYDAIIVGGGISGASIAHSLAKRKIKTLLLERHDDVASEGSGNPTGFIYPQLTEEKSVECDFSLAAFHYSSAQIESVLNNKDYAAVPFARGAFQIPVSDSEQQTILKATKNYQLDHNEIQFCQESFSGKEGFLFKNALTVPPRRLTRRLMESCREFLEVETYANYLGHDLNETFQVRTDTSIFSSKFLFLCHSNGFIETPDMNWFPLRRVRGQIALLPESENLKSLPYSYIFGDYLTRDIGSGSVLGASSDDIFMDESVRIEETKGFLRKAAVALPTLKAHFAQLESMVQDINTRVSFRLESKDKRPIFGKLPDYEKYKQLKTSDSETIPYIENLFVLGALGSKGLTHSIFASEIIVREALGEKNLIDQNLYRAFKPERFLKI